MSERKRDRFKRLLRGHDSESSGPKQITSSPPPNALPATSSATPSSTRNPPSQAQQPVSVTSTTGPQLTSQLAHPSNTTPGPAGPKKPFSSPHHFVEDARIKDFWNQALQTLSDEDKASISPYTTPSPTSPNSTAGLLDELCIITKQKQAECEKKGWKCTIRGREVILRDVAAKIITWLDRFKAVGDVAANFDPVHASLPWAGIRFLLEATVAESQQMAALLTGIEKVIYVINRCKVYEILYLSDLQSSQSSQAIENLESALVALYAAILQFLGRAISLYDKSTLNRASHALWHPGELDSFSTTCQTLEERVETEATNCERLVNRTLQSQQEERVNKVKDFLCNLQEPIVRTDSRVAELWDRSNQIERSAILQWASGIPYEKNHFTARQDRTRDTGEWLLKHSQYRDWRESSASMILWLHGIPGAGKTKLVSKIIDDLHHALESRSNDEALAYFYCDRNQTDRQDPTSVLRSFARQLSMARNGDAIQPLLVQLYNKHQQKGFASGELTVEDSQALLHQFVDIYPQTTLVLDALDESDRRTRQRLIDCFDSLVKKASKPVKIFISSRPDDDIKDRFRGGPNVEIRATDNHDDIDKFVAAKIEGNTRWRSKISAPLQKEVVKTLLTKSQGMFQWAALQIQQLLELYREDDVRDRLGKLPKDLEKAYDEIYAQIQAKPGSEPTIADRTFQWVMCSIYPLGPEELVAAVCQDPEKDFSMPVDVDIEFVLSACHNLVVVDPQLKRCRFSHLSVQEYLEKIWTTSKANGFAAKVCLVLLNDPYVYEGRFEAIQKESAKRERESGESGGQSEKYKPPDEPDQCLEPSPDAVQDQYEGESTVSDQYDEDWFARLIQYARHHWVEHIQRHGEEDIDLRVAALLRTFLGSMDQSGSAYRSWYKSTDNRRLGDVWKWDLDPPSSAAFAICAFGFHKILSSWWESGFADVNQKNASGEPLLQLALEGGHLTTVKALVRLGTDIHAQSEHYGTALHMAARIGHEAVARLLIEMGADVNVQGGRYGTALQAAAMKGNKTMVQLLLKSGADVNIQSGAYGTALQAAAPIINGKEVMQLLLKAGADVNIHGGRYGTALQAAAASYKSNEEVVRLLLEAGATVNIQGGEFGTALQAAASTGNKKIVQLLLEVGADMNIQGGKYGTALQAAMVYDGSEEVVRLLLKAGADVNIQGGKFGTVLQAAAYCENEEAVRLLLEAGADVNIQGGEFGTALQAAVMEKNKEMVRLLRAAGAVGDVSEDCSEDFGEDST